MELKQLFADDFARPIETVIKADDKSHILQEVEEYVITNEISLKLADFFEQYNNYEGANGVWISGFFGSGKSHLLKILSYVLEDRTVNGTHLGELFANKVEGDAKLKGDILNGTRIPSESILFNIDQQAQITSKEDDNAILQVFYKVLYEHQGFYGFQPHVAEFERWLSKEGNYEAFKEGFENEFGKPWEDARNDYVDPMIEDAIAEVCGDIYDADPSKYQGILDKFEDTRKYSIEDFAHKVDEYLQKKPDDFRLNFYVDEVGQYIADNTKLMLNLQTIAESLATKCDGRSWIVVTSQEDLESVVGDESATQSDDFSKIQGRFKIRLPLTSANVDEVIEKRLLAKGSEGESQLSSVWQKEKDNLATLLSFSEAGVQFKNYEDEEEFIAKYPFIPYQFDLFQQSIKTLAKHNAFQGKHASVGERSMLGVFQEVLKDIDGFDERSLISFDQLFEGLRATMRTEIQNSIILAERQLSNRPLAVRILKALFLVKYYDSFKTTIRNILVLTLNHLNVNPNTHEEEVKEALSLLEQQNYIERKGGDTYEFMTDIEKDIKQDIKNTEINSSDVTDLFSSLLFDGTIKETRLQFQDNKQYYEYTRKVDGTLYGREKELTVELVTPNSENYDNESYFQGLSMGNQTHMLMKLAPDDRIVKEARLYLQTEKYIKQNQATSNKDRVKQILFEQGQQNQERKREMLDTLNEMLAQSTVYLNGTEHQVSSTSDGKTKVIYAFQDLVKLAYSKLKMLGDTTFDESRLKSIMKGRQDDLFGEDEASMTPPENEVMNFIQRRKKMNERTTLTNLKEQFSQKPYGWPDFAIWCMVAMLFKRGKIIAKQDSNIIEDSEFESALMNNRSHANTLVYPQIEFDQGQVRRLKKIHQDLFNESNPHNEAKDAATLFKEKAIDELETVSNLIAQKQSYPFVEQLQPMADKLRKIKEMDYATLITEIGSMEDDLLDIKQDNLDPIKQFMNSGQKEIYDRLNQFDSYNQANFDYVDAHEKEVLRKAKEDSTPYRGTTMREAKEAMDTLEERVKLELKGEKDATIERYEEAIEDLKSRDEFSELSNAQKEEVMGPLQQELKKAKNERFIGNLRDQRSRLSNHLYTDQLNLMIELAQPEEDDEPKRMFIKQSNLHPSFPKKELETEEDVDDYLKELRKSMIDHINKNHNILLD
ncbi:BREX system P-loop protein BrxC [Fodinibius salsisoli]|uniref:BREX system P-loop protein BrxC n=1 Tax=Fodinibius salsisoli TaxID=2820877 RepID=A0ABT3PH32_9BACT|nr:BREX system P-loop protein BrxC [Fodinibius salsisoli]MCW9705232.1 BREX system P-loop protein BrxC [Fodinibius salsisoli]